MGRRYFPVSQDINADPEMLKLRKIHGDRFVIVWLEILSIAERNEGWLPGLWSEYPKIIGPRCNSRSDHVQPLLNSLITPPYTWVILDLNGVARVRNYPKYHKTAAEDWLSPNLTYPNLTKESYKNKTHVDAEASTSTSESDISVKEFVESWNEWFGGELAKVEWPLSGSRAKRVRLRLNEHKASDFWMRVFSNIQASPFLMGNGKGNWRCTMDFVVANDTNAVKIYEGQYSGQNRQRG